MVHTQQLQQTEGVGEFKFLESKIELIKLEQTLEKCRPRSVQLLNILKLKLQDRFTHETKVDFYIFQSGGNDVDNNGGDPFVLSVQQPNIWCNLGFFVFAPEQPTDEMMKAFEDFVPWDRIEIFSAVNQDFLMNHLQALCIKHGGFKSNPESGLFCMSNVLDPAVALDFPDLSDPKKGIELRSISKSDVSKMCTDYRYGGTQAARQLELSIENLASCGLYVDGVLASSAVLSPAGLINVLYTDEAFRKKGFGLMVMKELSKTVASMGLVPIAEYEPWNIASKNTQIKCGFKFDSNTNWLRFK